jgi:hypothetical protein
MITEEQRVYNRRYQRDNRARINERARQWRARNRDWCSDHQLKRIYGLTREAYNKVYMEQLGLCALCHQPFGDKTPNVDHCHETGKIRGLVHPHCNKVLGHAKDNVETLALAIEYLQKHVITDKLEL